jgi:hypothetical protein
VATAADPARSIAATSKIARRPPAVASGFQECIVG